MTEETETGNFQFPPNYNFFYSREGDKEEFDLTHKEGGKLTAYITRTPEMVVLNIVTSHPFEDSKGERDEVRVTSFTVIGSDLEVSDWSGWGAG